MPKYIHRIDAEQIVRWLKLLAEPDSTVEIRVIYPNEKVVTRHYKTADLPPLARDIAKFGNPKGIYWLMNPLPAGWRGSTAKDSDIVRRRWLLIDCDPRRKGTVSATDAEKEAARRKMIEIDEFLAARGWPAPVIGDSGNGFHLLYRIDLPGVDGELVVRVLRTLARLFNDDEVQIDTKVGNASRICRLYGTPACKGEHTRDRPHRLSQIVTIPDELQVLLVELMQSLIDDSGDCPVEAEDQPTPPTLAAKVRPSRPEAIEQARNELATMAPSIAGNHGHDRLILAASIAVNDYGLTEVEAFDLLTSEFNPRCDPPWNDADIRRKIGEAKKKPPNRPAKGIGIESTEAIVVRFSEVKEERLEWLWPNRIPLGKLTLLAGDPGLGKSFVTVDMAARVSTGSPWPDCPEQDQPVGSVILFNCEDDIADTVLPRFNRAGGDPSKVLALQGIATTDSRTGKRRQRGFSLDIDLPHLITVLESNSDSRLVVIDPVSAYCGKNDSHKNAEIRAMLAPLAELASRYRVSVVMVTHLAKGIGGKSVYRAMGSLAFAAASRALWHVAKDHDDDKRRLILMAKLNVCEETTGLAYRIQDGVVCWEDTPVNFTADDYLAKEGKSDAGKQRRTEQGEVTKQAVNWLTDKLSECSYLATVAKNMAEDADIAPATLKRAKKLAGVKSHRIGFGRESVVWWTLPPPDNELTDDELSGVSSQFP